MAPMLPPPSRHEKGPVTYDYTVWLTSGDVRTITAETCDEEQGALVFRRAGNVVERLAVDLVERYTSA